MANNIKFLIFPAILFIVVFSISALFQDNMLKVPYVVDEELYLGKIVDIPDNTKIMIPFGRTEFNYNESKIYIGVNNVFKSKHLFKIEFSKYDNYFRPNNLLNERFLLDCQLNTCITDYVSEYNGYYTIFNYSIENDGYIKLNSSDFHFMEINISSYPLPLGSYAFSVKSCFVSNLTENCTKNNKYDDNKIIFMDVNQ